jgi:carbonic anhydrase
METYRKLLLANRAWAKEKTELRPGFFESLAKGQNPDFLWIGCSDSRVPVEEITGAQPGEVFVHRNVANLYVASDVNLNSVLQFAVEHLRVKHIIVCGHYGCGGVKGALSSQDFGMLNQWLIYIKETFLRHRDELAGLDPEELTNRVVELNVHAQVMNLAKTALIQHYWRTANRPLIHGWVFGLRDGLLREIAMADPDTKLDPIYRFGSN